MTAAGTSPRTDQPAAQRDAWARRYAEVRGRTVALTSSLSAEDQQIQSMPDVSPTKWHLAHMSWFFETFLLEPSVPGYAAFDPQYGFLFNSYYEAVGARWPRPERGLLSRPSLDDVLAYRRHVDSAMARLIETAGDAVWSGLQPLLDLGLHHEQQHQELILMDIKHVFSLNPLAPAYAPARARAAPEAPPLEFIRFDGGLVEIGHDGEGFAFDNEAPRHKVWLEPFALANRLTTCGDYLAFIEDDGYARPELWLSEGWSAVQREGWRAPLYWHEDENGERLLFTLSGLRRLDPAEPVCHLSLYEADAFAVMADLDQAAVEVQPLQGWRGQGGRGLGRRIGRSQRVGPEHVLDVHQDQLLMLLLVIEAELDQGFQVRPLRRGRFDDQPRHGGVHMRPIGQDMLKRRP